MPFDGKNSMSGSTVFINTYDIYTSMWRITDVLKTHNLDAYAHMYVHIHA